MLAARSLGLSFGSGLFQAGGTRPPPCLVTCSAGAGDGAGCGSAAVCGAGEAGGRPQQPFPQLERRPEQCVGGTAPPTSVTSCFPSCFSGKADLTARNPTVVQRKGEAGCISRCPGMGPAGLPWLRGRKGSQGGVLATLACPRGAWRAQAADCAWDGVLFGSG